MQVLFIVSIFISSNKWTIYELYPGVGGYVTHPFTWTEVSLADVLWVDCSDGLETFVLERKSEYSENQRRGEIFCVINNLYAEKRGKRPDLLFFVGVGTFKKRCPTNPCLFT